MSSRNVVIKRLVLDVMKPHKPDIVDLGKQISSLPGISGCNLTVLEIDKSVENVKITIEGDNISAKEIEKVLEENGATVHSIDKVSIGRPGAKIVEEAKYEH
ncbi:MAG: hypothetical protein DRO07_02585 [Candidatus Iainarchaeum archaeon]|uniref:DUF211 domain-containing protein n=1 Tax=Candidatus Iainarchaeum sp. TaxID=3101447 RepID=A0A497JI35_9ARCH|nr:MAG: hypothetical protein DRO07_02585 [Candidatus Diapherotrites archaeon]